MNRKPFQEATVRAALHALSTPGGARRFLIADEVGLGKTRVAQGVIEGLSRPGRHLEIFYICSSLSIIEQNREALLDFLDAPLRTHAKVPVDRLTLLPLARPSRKAPFTLYTMTPGTLPYGRRTGRADERAVIWELLCRSVEGLSRHKTLEDVFSRGVMSWHYHIGAARERVVGELAQRFRPEVSRALGLGDAPWSDTLIDEMKRLAADHATELIGKTRTALARAALTRLAPDLIIFDEFQRFFEKLVPGEDEDEDPEARDLMERLLREDDEAGPAIILLSATPYRMFSGWAKGPQGHYEEFFQLLRFLFGKRNARREVQALQDDLRDYRERLRDDPVGSHEIFAVRDRIAGRLGRVMARTERPRAVAGQLRLRFETREAAIRPIDVRIFRHLVDSARSQDRSAAPAYWLSIPYPLQMMDQGYVLAANAEARPLLPEARRATVLWKQVRRFEAIEHPHPKLRQLLEELPPRILALPWMPPTRPWWPLGGQFAEALASLPDGSASKALLFSRFRAVPRAIAAILSYEAERFCFSPSAQRARGCRPVAYEYRTERGQRPAAGLKKRPSPTFTFPIAAKHETSMRSLAMFMPMPELAMLGDPLPVVSRDPLATREDVLREIKARLTEKLGRLSTAQRPQATWPWAAEVERSAPSWEALSGGVVAWLEERQRAVIEDGDDGDERGRGIRRAAETFFAAPRPARAPSASELQDIAEMALLAPGNVLYRAVHRVFGQAEDPGARVRWVTRASVLGLRTYLDQPDFHLLFRDRRHRQHPSAIRQAVWDGNLESTLDEYLASLRGLGVETPAGDVEERALTTLIRALSIGAASVTVHETGKESGAEAFRMRCYAALPFGLARYEIESEKGAVHNDDLRLSFNSPFRPHVLATTSIGQEGLDFHLWCNHVVHWDLPSNPVDLEQREGRVDRYAGLAVRRALAEKARDLPTQDSPWRSGAEIQREQMDGLAPWWVCEGAHVRRTVLVPTLSRMEDDLRRLLDQLSLYRLTLGQADQEALVHALQRRLADAGPEHDSTLAWLEETRINLGPSIASRWSGC